MTTKTRVRHTTGKNSYVVLPTNNILIAIYRVSISNRFYRYLWIGPEPPEALCFGVVRLSVCVCARGQFVWETEILFICFTQQHGGILGPTCRRLLSSGFIILGIPITVHDTTRDAILTCARRIAVMSQLNLPCTGNQKVEKRTKPNK